MTGRVYLVGAGPGDGGLITVRAAQLLREADVVLYDRLISQKIIDTIPKGAKRVYVGRNVGDDTAHQDTTNDLMAKYAEDGGMVVRLKGGDPIMFGRGGEEAEFLKGRKIEYEIVPGVTSGIGSATYAGIPLTHRRYSSSVVFVTGHEDPTKEEEAVRWGRLAGSVDTIVIMMGLSRVGVICEHLAAGGMNPDMPVAVIQNGTTPRQRMIKGTISDIAAKVQKTGMSPPANIIIGRVVDLSDVIGWKQCLME